MFAIIETGGKQYEVKEGLILDVEKLKDDKNQPLEPKASFTFDKVLLVFDGKDLKVGQPYVEGAKVTATVLEQTRDDKVIVFKFKRKTGYKRTRGHKQHQTRLKFGQITLK